MRSSGRAPPTGRRSARRTGVAALALLCTTAAAALVLAHVYHLGVPATLVAVLGGLPGLYLAWSAYRDDRRDADTGAVSSLAEVADQLARAVGSQWEAEAAIRRLNDPYPLPVSWRAADASLADDWDVLLRLVASGAGWTSPPTPATWASGPGELAGSGHDLVDVLARVPTGRLVVLGEPGSGKTMLMVRLVLDLLVHRGSGGPVPVLASMTSWDSAHQDLHSWLAARLVIDHPALAAAAPPGSGEGNRVQALLAAGLVLPVLDGLDEIPGPVRGLAITLINDALRPGEPLVVTCRAEQYRDVVRPPSGPAATLRGAAAIQLCPLDPGDVASYLRDDAAGPVAAARWDPVLAALGTQAPVGQALATPLMAGLARAIYNPRPGEHTGDLRDPAELCSSALTNRSAVEALLFDVFIPAAYRSPAATRWTARQAETWLVFLARHLELTIGSPDLAWWQLREAVPPPAFWLAAGIAAGLLGGLVAGLVGGLGIGIGIGLAEGLAIGLAVWRWSAKAPARGMRISVNGLMAGIAGGLGAGIAAGIAGGLMVGLGTGLGVGVVGVLVFGLAGVPGDLAGVTSPWTVLARDRQVALLIMIAGGLSAGIAGGLAGGLTAGIAGGIAVALTGLVAWYGLSMIRTAWPSYMLTRGWLASRRRLPWPLMSFLADAHQRGVLRQAGAVYQFRHLELQRSLATRPQPTTADPRGRRSDTGYRTPYKAHTGPTGT